MGKSSSPIKMFISYSRQDMAWLERVKVHLKPLVREEQLDCWDDNRIRPGARWQREIEAALQAAQVALLLVSPDFYASDYIATEELPRLLAQAEAGGTHILVLLLSPSRFGRDAKLNCFMALPDPKKPLSTLTVAERDDALDRLAQEVERLLDEAPLPPPPPPKTNPYDPYHAVLPPLFVGREEELRQLALCLDRRQSVSLVGDWRIGKSSLLGTWAQQARAQGRTVVALNGQAAEGESVSALVTGITGRACAAQDADAAAMQLDGWVRAQGEGLAPLVLLDEADRLLKQDHRFWARVRGMLDRCCWVLATRAEITEQSPDSPLANQMHLVRLGLLDAAAAEALVMLGRLGPSGEALLREWAGRHPFYVQLLGSCLHDAGGDEMAALDRFQDVAGLRLREWWNALPARDQKALQNWALGEAATRPALRRRGFVNEKYQPFGRVLKDWLEDLE